MEHEGLNLNSKVKKKKRLRKTWCVHFLDDWNYWNMAGSVKEIDQQ